MGADSIFALASAPGRAGIAVVRLSGPGTGEALAALAGGRPAARRASLRAIRDPVSGEALDQGLVFWFPGPASFTGEDMAELHLHGGKGVVKAVLAALSRIPDLRPAEPGEFTRRAFDHGRLDLTEVEGLADLIDAETEAQRRQALRQLGGELGRLYDGWRARLVQALARIEAYLDFPDEGLPAGLAAEVAGQAKAVEGEIQAHLNDARRGERLRDGLQIAILGPANAGKSSLLNLLARREAAIVSNLAGTTRDVIEVALDLGGYPVVVADTAGLRAVTNEVEAEGVRRAWKRAEAADIKIILVDGAAWPAIDSAVLELIDADSLVVVNKCDLEAVPRAPLVAGRAALAISVRDGTGIGEFLARLQGMVAARLAGNAPAPTRERHRRALEDCAGALGRHRLAALPELGAEDLRLAVRALGRITGAVDVEDILDAIFREFCIGK
jgi:tRNA modification GTPase